VAILLALAADAMFGIGVALQQRAATRVPADRSLRFGLLVALVRNRAWLAGLGAEMAGFALHVAALASAPLVLVQPLLTLDLVFTLAICAAWSRTPLTHRDWIGVAMTITGISIFLIAASPTNDGDTKATVREWLVSSALVLGVALVAALAARHATGVRRAFTFGIAAGMANGFMAVLTKAFADELGKGLGATLRSWEPYAVIGAGILAMLLIQSAYQAGHPTVVLPTINVVDPVVSVGLGVVLFGETINSHGPYIGVALVLAVSGLVLLGRNPLVHPETAPSLERTA
jgi:drug/metabolite transporter (DMT)-like permease